MQVGGNITINGGSILANGSQWTQASYKSGGPGINGDIVTINAGEVTAIGKGHTFTDDSGAGRLSARGGVGIGCDRLINLSGANVFATGDGSGKGIAADGNLIISDSTVTATGGNGGLTAAQVSVSGIDSAVTARATGNGGRAMATNGGNIVLNDGLSVVTPTGGMIGGTGSGETILDRAGNAALRAVISKPLSYEVWVGQAQVNSANYANVLGNGQVSYDPDTCTLTFTAAMPAIEGVHGNAMIRAGHDLTVIAPTEGLTLENANAAEGISAEGDLTLLGNVTVNARDRAVFAGKDLSVIGNLTARGQGTALTTGGLIEANGDVSIEGSLSGFNKTGYGVRAGDGVRITGDVKLTVVTGSTVSARGCIDIEGDVDNTSFDGQARVSENGLVADGDITVGGNVKLLTASCGVLSRDGEINVVTGEWAVNNASNGAVAMDAVKINIPDIHGVIDPVDGQVKAYDANGATREAVYSGDDIAKFATVYWKSEKPATEPAAPGVVVQPADAALSYGGAESENRTLTATATVESADALGTLRYRWQQQAESGYWRSVASGVDMTEYTVPTDEAAGVYSYRCMATNTLNGASRQAVSDPVTVTVH